MVIKKSGKRLSGLDVRRRSPGPRQTKSQIPDLEKRMRRPPACSTRNVDSPCRRSAAAERLLFPARSISARLLLYRF